MSASEVENPGMAPGNWLALEIRRFQEDSKNLFPAPRPGDEKIRYNTIYGIDYAPLAKREYITRLEKEMYKADTPMLLRRPDIKKEAPFSLEQAKRFNTWKVRKDLVEVDKVQQKVAQRRRTALEAAKREDEQLSFPSIPRSHTVMPAAIADRKEGGDKSKRYQVKTPLLPPGPQASVGTPARSVHGERKQDTRQSLPVRLPSEGIARHQNIKEDLLRAAEDYMQTASPHADRRVIDKALRTSNQHYREDPTTLQTELPNARAETEKWLEQATEEEQRIALQFFRSVGGMKLMGLGSREQQKRLDNLLTTLETGEAKQPSPKLSYMNEQKIRERKQRNLQFVRLLSPRTRNKRREHQSWHHLPMYQPANRADNVRSHYTQPQKVQPLHFSIHPDWGP